MRHPQHGLQFQLPKTPGPWHGEAEPPTPFNDGGFPCALLLLDIRAQGLDELLFEEAPKERIRFDSRQSVLLFALFSGGDDLIEEAQATLAANAFGAVLQVIGPHAAVAS